jgi:hypothetical protein
VGQFAAGSDIVPGMDHGVGACLCRFEYARREDCKCTAMEVWAGRPRPRTPRTSAS